MSKLYLFKSVSAKTNSARKSALPPPAWWRPNPFQKASWPHGWFRHVGEGAVVRERKEGLFESMLVVLVCLFSFCVFQKLTHFQF